MSFIKSLYQRRLINFKDVIGVLRDFNQAYSKEQQSELFGQNMYMGDLLEYFQKKGQRGEFTKIANDLEKLIPKIEYLPFGTLLSKKTYHSIEEFDQQFGAHLAALREASYWRLTLEKLIKFLMAVGDRPFKVVS